MTVTYLQDSDNIVRYVGYTKIKENSRIDGSAFCLRFDEDGLSVNWLEFFSDFTKSQQVAEVRRVIHRAKGSRAVFAELNVGDIKQYLLEELRDVRVISTPQPADDRFPEPDPSHCDIMGLPPAEAESMALTVGDMLAKRVNATHPAVL